MTLQNLPRERIYPGIIDMTGGALSHIATTLDAAGEYDAIVMQASRDLAISHIAASIRTVVASGSLDFRIETVDMTTGYPSGSLWATNTNGVTGALTSNVTKLQALTATANITRGQIFALKFLYAAGTSAQVAVINGALRPASKFPYRVTATPTATKTSLNTFCAALGSGATTFYHTDGLMPMLSVINSAFNNTNNAKRAIRFQVPMLCRCIGLRFGPVAEIGNVNVGIMNDAGTILDSTDTAIDGDMFIGIGSLGPVNCYFDNPTILTPGTTYRAYVEPSSATNIAVSVVTLPSADYRTTTPWGLNGHYASFASGSWTDSGTDQVAIIDLILDQLDDGINVAGSSSHRMLQG